MRKGVIPLGNNHGLRDEVKERIQEILLRNERISLRGIAGKIGVGIATFSDFVSGKKALSIENSQKVLIWLEVNQVKSHYLFLTNLLELSKKEQTPEGVLQKQLQKYGHGRLFEETKRVQNFLQRAIVKERAIYFHSNTESPRYGGIIRCLYMFRENRNFKEVFIDLDQMTSAQVYFLENENGLFTSLLGEDLEGNIYAMLDTDKNENLKVDFDQDGYPVVYDLGSKLLKTQERGEVELKYTKQSVVMEGHFWPESSPDNKYHFKKTYQRIL